MYGNGGGGFGSLGRDYREVTTVNTETQIKIPRRRFRDTFLIMSGMFLAAYGLAKILIVSRRDWEIVAWIVYVLLYPLVAWRIRRWTDQNYITIKIDLWDDDRTNRAMTLLGIGIVLAIVTALYSSWVAYPLAAIMNDEPLVTCLALVFAAFAISAVPLIRHHIGELNDGLWNSSPDLRGKMLEIQYQMYKDAINDDRIIRPQDAGVIIAHRPVLFNDAVRIDRMAAAARAANMPAPDREFTSATASASPDGTSYEIIKNGSRVLPPQIARADTSAREPVIICYAARAKKPDNPDGEVELPISKLLYFIQQVEAGRKLARRSWGDTHITVVEWQAITGLLDDKLHVVRDKKLTSPLATIMQTLGFDAETVAKWTPQR
jgi:hypothetical protein